ncbi:glycosyltransferase family 2 protein, partial [Candidatus Nomurabacteria bacterium]|nr:glycosyltransferase family 2 protein [Candidatus Nomurabacteria bacterium]
MDNSKLSISLVIPAFNEAEYISECLSHVEKTCGHELKEIIVVDNASTDDTALIASKFSNIKVVREEKKGTGPARQHGLATATGDLVAFIDADTRMDTEWIKSVKARFEKNSNIVCLSGPYKYYDISWFKNF